MVCVGGDLKVNCNLVPTSPLWTGTTFTTLGHSKPIEEHFQGVHNLSGNPVQVPHHPHSEELLSYT